MQTFQLEEDLPLFGIQASSFPAGVQEAWNGLHQKISTTDGRNFYGISHGSSSGSIVYKACVEEAFEGEAASLGCERFVLPKGDYAGEIVRNWMQCLPRIGEIFQELLARNDYDKSGVCVERYLNATDVVCMIKKATFPL